uniref:Uncharacterized protein n=1 Tax=Panagrolaimus davidi TaxID=227884 RepID=A0A914QFT0_9BILA
MLMVSDEMPTTSTFIPLIGWFILGMIIIISLGTLASCIVIGVQKRGRLGERLSSKAVSITKFFAYISFTEFPLHLTKGTKEYDEVPPPSEPYRKTANRNGRRMEAISKNGFYDSAEASQPQKKSWFTFRKRPTPNNNNNNNNNRGIVTDKSTDPLVDASTFASIDGIASDPASLPPLPPPASGHNPLNLRLALSEDISSLDSEPLTSRPQTDNIRQSRQLAQKEYEWLATVVERCNFIIFVLLFFLITFGINLLGFFHWSDIEHILYDDE